MVIEEASFVDSPRTLAITLSRFPGLMVLESSRFNPCWGRFSLVTADPFLKLRTTSWRCEVEAGGVVQCQFSSPWTVLNALMSRYELVEQLDVPFPLGGCFGWWGYDLRLFDEPQLPARASRDLDLPDCDLGFYDSLVAFDHLLGKVWVIASGVLPDGSRSSGHARARADFWHRQIELCGQMPQRPSGGAPSVHPTVWSNLGRDDFLRRIEAAQEYIRRGDIYQVNLSQRLASGPVDSPWELFERLCGVSPVPFSAFYASSDHAIASTSPELFLRLNGTLAQTRPIKGTRARSADPGEDLRLARELGASPKERAELLMITDLLRNDLGKVAEYGSVTVPELRRLEAYAHVQHLVSTIEGRLRPEVNHVAALAACFPGGSITGAPKVRAMEIIDELEPVSRGPYTGCLGYLGFNRESQLSILIRTAVCTARGTWFNVGAGIVADSDPVAEYEETLIKGRAFTQAMATVSAGHLGPPAADTVNLIEP
ncbi:MAG: anthranilate synthase component I family protein [Limisphaerales bacterium]